MDDSGPTASIILFLILLFVDMFFYGFGTAVSSLTVKDIDKGSAGGNDKKTLRLRKILLEPAGYVNTVQLIVTLTHLVIGYICVGIWSGCMEGLLTDFTEKTLKMQNVPPAVLSVCAVVLAVFFIVYIILTFGVLLPKKIAARLSEK